MSARTRKNAIRTRTNAVPSHLPILQLGVSIWNQWRANEPLVTPNLRNADLSGFHLENINLCRADLRGANLSSAYLYEADFQEANLRQANLTRAGLIGANLHRANMAGACIQQAYLGQSDLSNANLAHTNLNKADLQSALLTHTTFTHANLAEADLSHSFDLSAAQLTSAKDPHLAEFCDELRMQMGLPIKIPSSAAFSSQTQRDRPSESERSELEPIPFGSSRQPARDQHHTNDDAIEVFQPARKATKGLPALRRLALQ